MAINFLLNELTSAGTCNPQLSNICSFPLLIFFPELAAGALDIHADYKSPKLSGRGGL